MCLIDRRARSPRLVRTLRPARRPPKTSRHCSRYLAALAAGCFALGCGSDAVAPSDSTLSISATTHDFGAMTVGARSPTLALTVSNTGRTRTGTLTVTLTGATSDDFAILEDACTGAQLAPGATCTIEVEVLPTTLGLRQAMLTVTASDGDRVTAALSGTGASSGLSLSPTVVTFGEAGVGQTGATKTVVVRNTAVLATGAMTVTLTGAGAAAFEVTRDLCSDASLGAGASCAIDVRFVPASEGSQAATLSVAGLSAPSRSAELVGLAGEATTLTATPPGLYSFGAQQVSTSGVGTTFTIANTGTRPTGSLAIQLAGAEKSDFQVSANGCYPTLAAGASCSIVVTFSPLAIGLRAASVSISDAFGSNVAISMSGEGVPPPPPPTPLTMSPSGVFSFPPTLVGATISETVTVTNPGSTATGPLSTSVLVCDDYYYYGCYPSPSFSLEDDTCAGAALPAGGSCTASVTFTPSYVGIESAQLDVYAPGFTGTLAFSGTGTGLHPSTASVNFDPTAVGTASAPQRVVITNTGFAATGPLATEVSGFVFEIVNDTCSGISLAAAGSCAVDVRFEPTSPGGRFGTLAITATPGGTLQLQLYGVGL